uniref:Uncharacterized protein n=1 Tax=Chromera velia CCMP2878 TaxID=1169474 RepID=A0A0G4IE30_9ALVE|eukprot:Cvel_13481.t1-p1 / transcript=Cvel_13481.t1 / gene=Cvel_13481 / organism=Chromera_velia_CCMP2878 / gene_product=hypothetical protein / transcript_product=hypothetical protein / location=Cvel_scaffold922:55593-55826(-) / protein_length=78 / sequence_SO=supercontig / SO=protein_coding / is_pseudo=false
MEINIIQFDIESDFESLRVKLREGNVTLKTQPEVQATLAVGGKTYFRNVSIEPSLKKEAVRTEMSGWPIIAKAKEKKA